MQIKLWSCVTSDQSSLYLTCPFLYSDIWWFLHGNLTDLRCQTNIKLPRIWILYRIVYILGISDKNRIKMASKRKCTKFLTKCKRLVITLFEYCGGESAADGKFWKPHKSTKMRQFKSLWRLILLSENKSLLYPIPLILFRSETCPIPLHSPTRYSHVHGEHSWYKYLNIFSLILTFQQFFWFIYLWC